MRSDLQSALPKQKSMFPLGERGFFYLSLQFLCVIVLLLLLGWLSPRHYADTGRLTDFSPASLHDALSSIAPPGYPLFVRLVMWVSPKLTLLPFLHAALHFAALATVYAGLRVYGAREDLALIATSTLLYLQPFLRMTGALLSDGPAFSLALVVFGLVFYGAGRRLSVGICAAILLAVLAGWQTRGSNVFLVAFVPLGLAVLCRHRQRPCLTPLLVGAMITVIPLGGYMGLRKAVTGHGGVTPFFGSMLVGIAIQLPNDNDVASFRDETGELARAIRQRMLSEGWRPPVNPGLRLVVPHRIPYAYGSIVWQHAPAAAQDVLGPKVTLMGEEHIRYEKAMAKLASASIRRQPLLYLQWIFISLGTGIGQAIFLSPLLFLIPLYFLLTLLVWNRHRRPVHIDEDEAATAARRGIQILGILFFFGNMLLIAMVVGARTRYSLAAGGPLPMVLIPSLLDAWQRFRSISGSCRAGTEDLSETRSGD